MDDVGEDVYLCSTCERKTGNAPQSLVKSEACKVGKEVICVDYAEGPLTKDSNAFLWPGVGLGCGSVWVCKKRREDNGPG